MRALQIILTLCLFVVFITPAQARGGKWGDEENINFLADTKITSNKPNEVLYLAYKTTTQNYLLGAWISDDGYVLGVKGANRYYPLTDLQITEFQNSGNLPVPLPQYELSALDYALGFSLWILLAVIAGWQLVSHMRSKPEEEIQA